MVTPGQLVSTVPRQLLQLLRFGIVGITCLAFSVIILVTLHGLIGVNYMLAYVVTFIASSVVGYVLNARFTFSTLSLSHSGALRYMLVNAVLLCVNTAILDFLISHLHFWYITAAILLALINSPVSFVIQRLVTYHRIRSNHVRDT